MAEKEKVLRITVEFRMGGRKVHSGRIIDAYSQGIEQLTEAVKASMPEGNVTNVHSYMEWMYLYERSEDIIYTDGEDLHRVEPGTVA